MGDRAGRRTDRPRAARRRRGAAAAACCSESRLERLEAEYESAPDGGERQREVERELLAIVAEARRTEDAASCATPTHSLYEIIPGEAVRECILFGRPCA